MLDIGRHNKYISPIRLIVDYKHHFRLLSEILNDYKMVFRCTTKFQFSTYEADIFLACFRVRDLKMGQFCENILLLITYKTLTMLLNLAMAKIPWRITRSELAGNMGPPAVEQVFACESSTI